MPKARKRKQPSAASLPANLPLQATPDPTLLPAEPQLPAVGNSTGPDKLTSKKRDRTVLPSNSLVRSKVLAIVAMKLEGKTNEEISLHLNIKESSIKQYMWLAGKNGWLRKNAIDPTDRLEHEIAHKVVRNLDEMLDSDDVDRRDTATMKTAEGMLFKRYAAEGVSAPPLAIIGIRIEMPDGAPVAIREGTTGGAQRWVEGVAVDAKP